MTVHKDEARGTKAAAIKAKALAEVKRKVATVVQAEAARFGQLLQVAKEDETRFKDANAKDALADAKATTDVIAQAHEVIRIEADRLAAEYAEEETKANDLVAASGGSINLEPTHVKTLQDRLTNKGHHAREGVTPTTPVIPAAIPAPITRTPEPVLYPKSPMRPTTDVTTPGYPYPTSPVKPVIEPVVEPLVKPVVEPFEQTHKPDYYKPVSGK